MIEIGESPQSSSFVSKSARVMIPQSTPNVVRGARGRTRGAASKHPPERPLTDTRWKKAPTKRATPPRPTHFIALPIGHHAELRELMGRFGQSLLNKKPPIPGIDESVIILPRRLHFTLGVMVLANMTSAADLEGTPSSTNGPRTVDDATRFLESLKPRVDDLLQASIPGSANRTQKLRVNLDSMDVMKLERGGAAHVLWLGPKDGNLKDIPDEGTNKLRQVCDFIHSSFKNAGFLVEDNRPLKLHCTIVNTVYRKPKPRDGKRVPFAYTDLLMSPWFSRQGGSMGSTSNTSNPLPRDPVSVDFGSWDIDEIQICEMGSHGPEGEYVCAGNIAL